MSVLGEQLHVPVTAARVPRQHCQALSALSLGHAIINPPSPLHAGGADGVSCAAAQHGMSTQRARLLPAMPHPPCRCPWPAPRTPPRSPGSCRCWPGVCHRQRRSSCGSQACWRHSPPALNACAAARCLAPCNQHSCAAEERAGQHPSIHGWVGGWMGACAGSDMSGSRGMLASERVERAPCIPAGIGPHNPPRSIHHHVALIMKGRATAHAVLCAVTFRLAMGISVSACRTWMHAPAPCCAYASWPLAWCTANAKGAAPLPGTLSGCDQTCFCRHGRSSFMSGHACPLSVPGPACAYGRPHTGMQAGGPLPLTWTPDSKSCCTSP